MDKRMGYMKKRNRIRKAPQMGKTYSKFLHCPNMQARDFAWTSTEANAAALSGDKLDVVVGSWVEIENISKY